MKWKPIDTASEEQMAETQTRAPIQRRSTPRMGKLTIEMEPDLHRDIKVAATLARVSLREYITSAMLKKMEEQQEALKAS